MATGYSVTALAKKLGVKDGQRTWRCGMPATVAEEIGADGVRPVLLKTMESGLEMVHLFVMRRRELAQLLGEVRPLLTASGTIWVSWPKKTSRVPTDVTDHVVREEAFPLGLVDVKVCAVDETWSGLKLAIRKTERA